MAKLITIVALIITIYLSFWPAFVFKNYCKIASAFDDLFTEVFRFFWFEYALDLIYDFVIYFW